MSDEELPSWLEELRETEPDEVSSQTKKRPPSPQKAKSKAKKIGPLTPAQMMILAGLALVLCFICAGMGGVVYVNQDTLWGPPPQEVAAVAPVAVTPTTPMPTPTITDTPTPAPPTSTPTSMLPTVEVTLEPSPTATYAVAPEFINKDKIAEITEFVETWRQLALPEDIPINFLTRRQLREQWQEDSFDKAAIEAVQTQQEFYTAMGLIEPDVDLVEAAFDSQTDIMLGYYTPEEKVMYIIAESVNMFAQEEMTFAHEYVHALQDYHFDLDNFLNEDASGDALLAARSLPEGDARLIEDLFTSQNISQDQLDYTVYRYLFQEHPQLEGVSPALGIFTYFPYTAGEYFVIYLFIEGDFSWDKVNQAYSNPPISSEQVMHPEKYLASERPVPITLPDLAPALGDTWREIDRDVLGEAGFLVWLIDQVEDTAAIDGAAGWDGDAYTLWVEDVNQQRVLAESSLWETEADAIEFFETFTNYMNLREGEAARYEEAGTYFWEYEVGITLLHRQGRQVLIIIAPDRIILDRMRTQFPY